jgi:hypothetical protein
MYKIDNHDRLRVPKEKPLHPKSPKACQVARVLYLSDKIERAEEELVLLADCLRKPRVQPPGASCCGCVYLLPCPGDLFKIGWADNHRNRLEGGGGLRKRLKNKQLMFQEVVYTPVSCRLERVLHRHYRFFHEPHLLFPREMFRLPPEEVEDFMSVLATLERHLLLMEVLRAKSVLRWCNERLGPALDGCPTSAEVMAEVESLEAVGSSNGEDTPA